jgi:uncharacterized protein (DUF1697 family)
MAGWVALLRGINLGARNRIPMAGLKAAFEDFGAEEVRTHIVSGNVVFTHKRTGRAALAQDLQKAIADAFGVDTPVILRTFQELRATAARTPFGDDNTHTYVTFLVKEPSAAAARATKELAAGDDRIELIGADMFLHLPNGLAKASISFPKVEKAIGVPGTNRNFRTVTKLAEMTRAMG